MSAPRLPQLANQEPRLELTEIPEWASGSQFGNQPERCSDEATVSLSQLWKAEDGEAIAISRNRSNTAEDDGEISYFQVPSRRRWPWLAIPVLVFLTLAAGGGYWAHLEEQSQPPAVGERQIAAGSPTEAKRFPTPASPPPSETAQTGDMPELAPASPGTDAAAESPAPPQSSQDAAATSPPTPRPADAGPNAAPAAETSDPVAEATVLRANLERQISAAVGDCPAYARRLNDYLAEFPAGSPSDAYRRVIQSDLPALAAVAAWSQMLDRWAATDMRSITPTTAAELLGNARTWLADCEAFPAASAVRQRCVSLSAVAARTDDQGQPIQTQLLELFRHPALSAKFVLQTNSGQRYYLTGAPLRRGELRIGEYLADLNCTRKTVEVPNKDIDPQYSGAAAEGKLAQNALDILAQLDHSNWEQKFCRLIEIVRAEQRVDPRLQTLWLEQVLTVACRGSQPLQDALGPQLGSLRQLGFSLDLNWLDPNDPAAQRAREQARQFLWNLPNLLEAVTPAVAAQRSLQTFPAPSRYVWSGRLSRTPTGVWQCLSPAAAAYPNGPLLVIHRSAPAGPYQVQQIGVVSDGQPILSSEPLPALLEGRPVYTLSAPSPAPVNQSSSRAPPDRSLLRGLGSAPLARVRENARMPAAWPTLCELPLLLDSHSSAADVASLTRSTLCATRRCKPSRLAGQEHAESRRHQSYHS